MTTIPAHMHAIRCRTFGGPEVLAWGETATPIPKDHEVLIEIAAAGLNRADLLQRQGKYPPPEGAGDIFGMEVAGEVVALGAMAKRWKLGDKVCALLSSGGYAEYVAAPEAQCLPVPDNLSLIEAAALPEAIATVYANIFETAALKPGETLLVHGGSSGIGTTAIQMTKLFGARIFVTAGGPEKCATCVTLGADLAIDYKKEDFVEAALRATDGRGVDCLLDMIGGDYLPRNLKALAPLGRHVSIATQHGSKTEIDVRLLMQKRLTLTGSTLRGRSAQEKAQLIEKVTMKIWPWVVEGKLKPLIYKTYPLKNAGDAHICMESGLHMGKIVLEVKVSSSL